MKGKLNDRDAKCPFILAHTNSDIYCESPVDGSMMRLRFCREDEKSKQYKCFCCRKYDYCEIYRANMEKYDDEKGPA